jgi:cysteinyl-tRNA synthetase
MIYIEYDVYCESNGMTVPHLALKKQESISGKSSIPVERLRYLEHSEHLTVAEVEELINARNEARRQCNFVEADRIRNVLRIKGIALMDEKGGRGKGRDVTTWKFWKHS